MFRNAEASLSTIHIGGDEVPAGVWEKSPVCNSFLEKHPELDQPDDLWPYFVERFNRILTDRDLITAGWEEIAMHRVKKEGQSIHEPNPGLVDKKLQLYFWNAIFGWGNEDGGYQLANAGYKVVLCNASNLYFDLAYDKDPEENGLYWAGFVDTKQPFEFIPFDLFKSAEMGRFGESLTPAQVSQGKVQLTPAGRQNILGIQGQLWSEVISDSVKMEYALFPKLIALAERAWALQPPWAAIEDDRQRRESKDEDWNQFANTIAQVEMPRLDHLSGGLAYRVPPPGVKIENSKVLCNTAFPGLIVRYTTDGSEPDLSSPVYQSPINYSDELKFKAFSPSGRGSRTVSKVAIQSIQ